MSSRRRPRTHKTISRQGLLGQKGINLIERIVLDMGSRWTPSGPNEVGIDGYIELFDPNSGEPLGKTVAVQSKAVSAFSNETGEYFDYWCDRRDIAYWLQGNTPVILVVSRPASRESYWASVKDYFAEIADKSSSKIRFAKSTQRFTSKSHRELLDLGCSPEIGLYLAPVPRREQLCSNLLQVEQYPSQVYLGSTNSRFPLEIWTALNKAGHDADAAWVLRDKRIMAFHDLTEMPWSTVCDVGSVESFDAAEWADSEDLERRRQFVQLLNQTLRAQVGPAVRYWPAEDCYAFVGGVGEGAKKQPYRSFGRQSRISVISKYQKTTPDGRAFEWLRHLAFRGKFRRLGGQWYLEITPTYRFTRDGYTLDYLHEERLKGIKLIEGNRAVLSGVLLWGHYLTSDYGLFGKTERPLRFGQLLEFDLEVGITDDQWQSHDPVAKVDEANVEEPFLPNLESELDI